MASTTNYLIFCNFVIKMTLQKKNTTKVLHRLDYDENHDDVLLIAIKSNMSDYKMAYHINQTVGLKLQKPLRKDIVSGNTSVIEVDKFHYFKYKDIDNHLVWWLIENKYIQSVDESNDGKTLFDNEADRFDSTEYLVPEWKSIDFFLLVENTDVFFDEDELLSKLESINNISTQFVIDRTTLSTKSQQNLIF